jgi:hypothetical protein
MKCRSQPLSRILFPHRRAFRHSSGNDNHSSSPAIAHRVQRPTRWPGAGRPHNATLFGLAPCGVLPAIRVATDAVRSYRTFSPLPFDSRLRAVYFLCHCPSSYPARALPGALPFGVRTFLSGRHFTVARGYRPQRLSGWLRPFDYRRSFRLPIDFLLDAVLFQLLVQVAARGVDDFGGFRDVPAVLPELLDEVGPFRGVLELS